MRHLRAVLAVLIPLVGMLALGTATAAPGDPDRPVFTISDPDISESSALAVSTEHQGLAYTMNDSGDEPVVYVLDRTGETVGRATLEGAVADDVEAMSIGQDGSLAIGDIGDNDEVRDEVEVYFTEQPGRGDTTLSLDHKLDLTYQGGPRDAESMLWDSKRERLYVVAKFDDNPRVFATKPDVLQADAARLTPIADGPLGSTDATWLPGTSTAAIRSYVGAGVYEVPSFERVTSFPLPRQRQGETIAAPDARTVWVGSEGRNQAVYAVPVPPGPSGPGGPGGQTTDVEQDPGEGTPDDLIPVFAIGLVVVGLLLIALAIADWWRKR